MRLDERCLPLSTDSEEAVRLFDRAVEHYLKYHIDTMALVGSAIAEVVIPACEAGLAHRRGEHARVVELLVPRRDQIRLLGGSNAQRDLFFQMLIDSAMRAGRRDVVSAMIEHETATRAAPPMQRAGYAVAGRWLQ